MGICYTSIYILYFIALDSISDSEGPDQTARMATFAFIDMTEIIVTIGRHVILMMETKYLVSALYPA